MGERHEVRADDDARKAFVDGVLALKQEQSGVTTGQLGLAAPSRPVSTYDLFVVWHHLAMHRLTPADQSDRNAAHSGPAFLPWHRLMLLLFELQVQRVLGSPDFGLPYWDWAADGDLPTTEQVTTALWGDGGVGGTGDPVGDGPFRAGEFTVRLESDATARLVATERPLVRALGVREERLPTRDEQAQVLRADDYDAAPWDSSSGGFRNALEGWPDGPSMHNRVHVWIGGDMLRASSPNDPVFFLNHANADRLWESWMRDHGRHYIPGSTASAALTGHRIDDALYSILIQDVVTPADMLEVPEFATYDVLP